VQRLATIANGDGICTTHVTPTALAHIRGGPDHRAAADHRTTDSTTTGNPITQSGGSSA
jgi:hypothetical protein